MRLTQMLRGLFRLPNIRPEVVAVWLCLGFAGYLLLDEWSRWLSTL